jgi:peptidoglycan/LPS O-acetylase OafA/YrhL
LLLGVLAAVATRDPGFAAAFARNRVALGCVFAGLLGGMVTLSIRLWNLPPMAYHLAAQFWIAAFYAMLIVWVTAKPSGAVGALMRFPALRMLGVVSYAVYLFHVPVMETVFALARGQPPALRTTSDATLILASLGVTLGLAALSWHLVERPLLRLGHRFKY